MTIKNTTLRVKKKKRGRGRRRERRERKKYIYKDRGIFVVIRPPRA